MPHTVPEEAVPRRAWEALRGVATVGLLAWLFLELWLFAGASRGSGIFTARLAVVPLGASVAFLLCLVVHVLSAGALTLRPPSPAAAPSPWVRLADRVALIAVWGLAAGHFSLFWRGVAGAAAPFDAWVETLGATPGGVPLVAFAYLLGFGACAYATARAVIVAERRGSWLAVLLGVALGAVVLWVGGNGVVAVATGAGWGPMAPVAADPCGTP